MSPPRPRPTRAVLVALTVGVCVHAARAQTVAQAEDTDTPPLERVVVTATRSAQSSLGSPASMSVVDADELRRRPVSRIGDTLADVPGVYVRGAALGAAFPASGQAVLSLRGIPRTPRTLVMVDGQPMNNALTGGVNVAGMPLEGVERVEIVRGPYSALYGGNAMGGVIHFITAGPDSPLTELRLGAGSLEQRGLSFVHRQRYDSGLGVTLSLGWRESKGDPDTEYVIKQTRAGAPGAAVSGAVATTTPEGAPAWWVGTKGARPWWQGHGQLALHYAPGPDTRLRAGVAWAEYGVGHSQPTTFLRDGGGNPVFSGVLGVQEGGVPRRLSLASGDFLTPTPAGEQDRRFFVSAEHRFEGGARLQTQLSTLRHSFGYVQPATSATYDGGAGQFVDQPNGRDAFDVSLRVPVTERWTLTGGLAIDRSHLDRRTHTLAAWRDEDSRTGVAGSGSGSATNTAAFVQSEHELGGGVSAYLGGRYDRFRTRGHVTDTAGGFDQVYGERSYSEFSPKVALVWEVQPWLSLRTSYGEAFRPPSLLDMYARTVIPTPIPTINDPAPLLSPERVRSIEFGADLELGGQRRASVTLYAQQLEDLIYRRTLAPTATMIPMVTENVGQADVNGIEASVHWPTPLRGLRAFGAVTHQMRYHVSRNDASPASVGKVLTDVPRTTWSTGLELERNAWSGFIAARHAGHVFASGDDENTKGVQGVYGAYDRYTVVSAKVAYRFDKHWSLSVAVDNLTDREYFALYRQPGRSVYAELSHRF